MSSMLDIIAIASSKFANSSKTSILTKLIAISASFLLVNFIFILYRGTSMNDLICNRCGTFTPIIDMHKNRWNARGYDCYKKCHAQKTIEYQKTNKEKINDKNIKWDRNNPDKRKDAYYRRMYGITLDEYSVLHSQQKARCRLCGTEESLPKSRLGVDHCHDTGRIRGLLCDSCNTALGRLGDSIQSIEKVLSYIKGELKDE